VPLSQVPAKAGVGILVMPSLSELPLSLAALIAGAPGGVTVGLSSAPLSHAAPTARGKPAPRWSVARALSNVSLQPLGSPESKAGLPLSNACVGVAPPLSASAGDTRGSTPVTSPTPVKLQLLGLCTRL